MKHRNAYELSASQVHTPPEIVELFWQLTSAKRDILDSVLDLGAGDCRFAIGSNASRYVGIEIDRHRVERAIVPPNGQLIEACAFKYDGSEYAACIGNPPYVRHHHLGRTWKAKIARSLERQLGFPLNQHCNLYLYFLCLGLLKTKDNGLVSMVIPYEWVSRPSARPIREHIVSKGWDVSVYRFEQPIFPGVQTTASITLIDKSSSAGSWQYFDVDAELNIRCRNGPATASVISYAKRGRVWALRGLSPGSQDIFTLTEGERLHNGLRLSDVEPCITTLKHVPTETNVLSASSFKRLFIETGNKCWLIKCNRQKISTRLKQYLESVPESARNNWTCRNQEPWYNFSPHPVPKILISSAFVRHGPKMLINQVGAYAIGTVCGIHADGPLDTRAMQLSLRQINMEQRVVPHAGRLKKVEVRQLNSVLNEVLASREQ